MSIQYILRGYSVSEINFEAIGRCQHLKGRALELRRERDNVFRKIKHSYDEPHMDTAQSVHYFDSSILRNIADKLDEINIELMSVVDEYNKWAKEAELPLIKIIKRA
jgi:hypothetical protein